MSEYNIIADVKYIIERIIMSKWDKLLKRILTLSNDIRFAELKKILESYGYVMRGPSSGSSHYTFRKTGYPPITVPKHEPIKKVYVLLVKQVIEEQDREN